MLTYPCQSEVFKFLNFEKRYHLAKSYPEIRKRHQKFPFFIKNLEISVLSEHFNLKIEKFSLCVNRYFSKTTISHNFNDSYKISECHVDQVAERAINYFLGREGTVVLNFSVKGEIRIPVCVPRMKIFNLSVNSDENIVTWFHVAKGNQFRNLRIVGRSVFRLLDLPEITESIDVEIATSSSKDIKGFALQKLTKNRYLRLKFVSFHGRYHGLSEEIQQISLQNRPIGSVIDYCVLDFFRNKVYPNFARIETDLKAKRTKIDEKDAIKIPMKNNDAELVVFLIPDQYDKEMGSMWILRMMVTEKKQDN